MNRKIGWLSGMRWLAKVGWLGGRLCGWWVGASAGDTRWADWGNAAVN